MKRKRNRLGAIVIVTVLTATMSSAFAANANAGTLSGAGSSLMAPLMAQWAADFHARTGNTVNYASVGSGQGITQITNRTVDFGASDAPLTPAQAGACNGCVMVPWALTATVMAYNLPGVGGLRLSPQIVAAMYLGQITNWNDPRIARMNKGKHLPNLAVTPVHRSDGSGDTYAFTDLMSRVSKTWKRSVGTATSVSFPVGPGGNKNDGVTALVNTTPGAIGYISAAYAIAHGLPAAALENRAKKFVFPNLRNIEAAAKVVTKVPKNNVLHIVNPPKSAKAAYPLSTFSYAIVPHGAPQKALFNQFASYALTLGQRFGPALDFAAIPKVVVKASKKSLAKL